MTGIDVLFSRLDFILSWGYSQKNCLGHAVLHFFRMKIKKLRKRPQFLCSNLLHSCQQKPWNHPTWASHVLVLTQDCQIVQGHDQVIKAPPHILERGGPKWAGLGRPVPRNAPKFIVVTSGQSGPARAGHDQSRPAEYTVNNVCDVGRPLISIFQH